MSWPTRRDPSVRTGPAPLRRTPSLGLAVLVLAVAAACGGETRRAAADSAQSPQSPGAQAPRTPPAGAAAAAPAGTLTEADISPQMIALGDSIFKGQAASGICFTCHGPGAEGGTLAPNLTDQEWLNGDGSLAFIENTVRNGVPQPKQHPAPMPPFGSTFTEAQVQAVAAYVYSRSHPNVGGTRP